MKIGFTGTRYGMTAAQKEKLGQILRDAGVQEFHHGDCVGADDEAATLVRAHLPGVRIVCHPPQDKAHQAHNANSDEILPAKTHLARNRDIVTASQMVVAASWETQWQPKGGTWYTVDYARKQGKPVYILYPDGRVEYTNRANGDH